VLTGDGELQEGSNWEAAMAAANYSLDSLTVVVDRNTIQLTDATEKVMRLEPLAEKLRAFGFTVGEVDGHDMTALVETLGATPFETGRPSCVLAHTHKGQGVSFIRDKASWHHRVPTDEELEAALEELSEVAP
jgi:transketolase